VQGTDDERAERGQQVAQALRDATQPGRDQGRGAAQHDQGQRQGETAALGEPERGDPEERAGTRCDQQPAEADGVRRGHGQDQRALRAHPARLRRREEGAGRADHVGEPQHQAALPHGHAGVGQQGRQPGRDGVELHALQPEVRRHLAGQRLAEQRPRAGVVRQRVAGAVRPAGAGDGQPQGERGERERQPEAECRPPVEAECLGQRHGERGACGRADVQRGRVEAHHQAGAAELPLDVCGHEHVGEGDRGAGQHAAREEQGDRGEQPQRDAGGQQHQRERDRRLEADPPGQPGRRRCERPETEDRQRRQQPGERRGQPGVRAQVAQHRRHRHHGRALVQRDADDRRDEQDARGPAARHLRWPGSASRRRRWRWSPRRSG